MRAPSPGSVLDLVQRGAGNASVSRMLARQAVSEAEQEAQGTPAVTPHEPGDMSEDLLELAGGAGGLAGAFGGKAEAEAAPGVETPGPDIGGPQQTAGPTEAWLPEAHRADAQKAKPPVPPEITTWFREQPSTNATIADWLLRGKDTASSRSPAAPSTSSRSGTSASGEPA